MGIDKWPKLERPREKLLEYGPGSLSDAELLAIFLRTGVKGYSALDLARKLLMDFGGLREIMKSSLDSFSSHYGLGAVTYVQLQACLELGRRHLQEQLSEKDIITCPEDTKRYLLSRLRDKNHEVFVCLYLDNKHQILQYEELFRGTIDGASVHPREVVKQALAHNAAAMIIAHNHPSGVAEPSHNDKQITWRINEALALVEIRLLDHMIVGDGMVTSLAERGII